MPERRKPVDHDIVMAVIHSMRGFGYLLYGALAVCLVGIIGVGIFTGKWELAIVTALIAAVSGGANAAGGFMAGVLSQTRPQLSPDTPQTVKTAPDDPLAVKDAAPEKDEADSPSDLP